MKDKRYLMYRWYEELYMIDIDSILSVTGIDDMVKTNREELKISTYNGRSLPVIDAVSIFSIRESDLTKESKIVVIENEGIKFGLLIDGSLGVDKIQVKDIEEASLNEKKFVTGIYKGVKLVDPKLILDSGIKRLIVSASNMDTTVILNSNKAMEQDWNSKDFLMNEVRSEILNLLLTSNTKDMDKAYLDKLANIHQMVEKI